MKIRVAELNIELSSKYRFTERFCAAYTADFAVPDLRVEIGANEIETEVKTAPHPISPGYAECICIYRHIALALPRFGAFVFHSAVVEYKGKAYAFAARSGVGKSTHVALWETVFGSDVRVINGDKPIFRFVDGQWRAYGTPWCGKEGKNCNDFAPLQGICFIERAAENRIESIAGEKMLPRLFMQVLTPTERNSAELFLDLLADLTEKIPCYLLFCNREPQAAKVAYFGMNKEKCDETKQ